MALDGITPKQRVLKAVYAFISDANGKRGDELTLYGDFSGQVGRCGTGLCHLDRDRVQSPNTEVVQALASCDVIFGCMDTEVEVEVEVR